MFNINILIVTNTLGRFGETNGVEYTYNNLLKQFSKTGIKTDVVCYGSKDSVETDGSVTIYVHKPRVPFRIDPELLVDLAMPYTKLARIILKKNYSLVHSSTPDPLGYLGAKAAATSDCPLVTVYHTFLDYYARVRVSKILGKPAGKVAERFMLKILQKYYNRSEVILAPTHEAAGEISKVFSPPIEIMSRGIDRDLFSPKFRNRDKEIGKKLAEGVYVGRVALEKNLDSLVDIFSQRKEIDLKVVGDGPYLSEMKSKLPEANFTGKLTGEPLSRAFANADYFVFPSVSDSFGNVVLQAMCSGLPSIVTDKRGPKELIEDGVTGFITGNRREFAQAVDRLATDNALRRKMGKAAREASKKYEWGAVFQALLKTYKEVIGQYSDSKFSQAD